jgi:hypothetical protein
MFLVIGVMLIIIGCICLHLIYKDRALMGDVEAIVKWTLTIIAFFCGLSAFYLHKNGRKIIHKQWEEQRKHYNTPCQTDTGKNCLTKIELK